MAPPNEYVIHFRVQDSQTTILEDFLIRDLANDDQLNHVLQTEKRTAELNNEYLTIHGVPCATHTLDLGVKDTIGKKKKRLPTDPCLKYVATIDAASTVVAKLRSSKMKIAIESDGSRMPVPFIEIRWSSANNMVNIICLFSTSLF